MSEGPWDGGAGAVGAGWEGTVELLHPPPPNNKPLSHWAWEWTAREIATPFLAGCLRAPPALPSPRTLRTVLCSFWPIHG